MTGRTAAQSRPFWSALAFAALAASARPGGLHAGQSEPPVPAAASSAPSGDRPDRAALERGFAALLTNAALSGSFQLLTEDGLSPPHTDRYTIARAEKVDGDTWRIACRIQYGDKDVTVPLLVRVIWADDTPIIAVDDLWVPGIGMYTARVVFHRNCYSGTWFGKGYGGVMSGRVERGATSRPAR